jgi:hypothetical protein
MDGFMLLIGEENQISWLAQLAAGRGSLAALIHPGPYERTPVGAGVRLCEPRPFYCWGLHL